MERTPVPPGLSQRYDSAQVDAVEGLRSSFVVVRDPSGELVGGARITIERRRPSRHLELLGGPIFRPGYEDEVRALVSKAVREMVLVVDSGLIRPIPGHPWHLDEFGLHRTGVPAETVVVDLTKSEDELWRGVDHSVRQGVRKARDHGLTVREVDTERDVERIYPLIGRFGQQREFETVSRSRLLTTFRLFHPAGRVHILLCEAGSEPAGVGVLAIPTDRAGLMVVAGAPEFAKVQMNSLLDWEAMRFCKAHGATSFDFLGLPPLGSGLEGLRRFKLKWGGAVLGGEEYLEGVLYRVATDLVRRWPKVFGLAVLQRGPFRNGIR